MNVSKSRKSGRSHIRAWKSGRGEVYSSLLATQPPTRSVAIFPSCLPSSRSPLFSLVRESFVSTDGCLAGGEFDGSKTSDVPSLREHRTNGDNQMDLAGGESGRSEFDGSPGRRSEMPGGRSEVSYVRGSETVERWGSVSALRGASTLSLPTLWLSVLPMVEIRKSFPFFFCQNTHFIGKAIY
jgi:hypothetical protein